jgi:hypothetical protein
MAIEGEGAPVESKAKLEAGANIYAQEPFTSAIGQVVEQTGIPESAFRQGITSAVWWSFKEGARYAAYGDIHAPQPKIDAIITDPSQAEAHRAMIDKLIGGAMPYEKVRRMEGFTESDMSREDLLKLLHGGLFNVVMRLHGNPGWAEYVRTYLIEDRSAFKYDGDPSRSGGHPDKKPVAVQTYESWLDARRRGARSGRMWGIQEVSPAAQPGADKSITPSGAVADGISEEVTGRRPARNVRTTRADRMKKPPK